MLECEKIWFSPLLERQFPEAFKEIIRALEDSALKYGLLDNTSDIWCRDYMPVKGADGEMVLFRYFPSYLRNSEKGRKSITGQDAIFKCLGRKCKTSAIILDGGAIEIHKDQGIVSDRLFRDNYETWGNDEKGLLEELRKVLSLRELFVVPQHPYDFTGHVDGLVRFIDEKRVLINDLMPEYKQMKEDPNSYRKKLIEQWYYPFKMALHNANLECEELVCMISENEKDSDAYGIYLNFLLLDDLVVVPGFDHKNDEVARLKLENIYDRKAITVQATELAKEGGIINCVTWIQ